MGIFIGLIIWLALELAFLFNALRLAITASKKNDKKNGINGLVKNWRRPIYPILALASYIFFIHRVTNL